MGICGNTGMVCPVHFWVWYRTYEWYRAYDRTVISVFQFYLWSSDPESSEHETFVSFLIASHSSKVCLNMYAKVT